MLVVTTAGEWLGRWKISQLVNVIARSNFAVLSKITGALTTLIFAGTLDDFKRLLLSGPLPICACGAGLEHDRELCDKCTCNKQHRISSELAKKHKRLRERRLTQVHCAPTSRPTTNRRCSRETCSRVENEWRELLRRCGGKCLLCGTTEGITRDHIIPISKGGDNSILNLQPLCGRCNSRKHANHIDLRTDPVKEWLREYFAPAA